MDNQYQENRTFWTGHFGDRGHFGVRTFIEIRRNVLFFLKGDISAKGDISVSNRVQEGEIYLSALPITITI